MNSDQLLVLYFGLPIAILGAGLRRALGARVFLGLLVSCSLLAAFGAGVELLLHRAGHGLPLVGRPGAGFVRTVLPYDFAAILLGALGAVMIRFRSRGQAPPAGSTEGR